MATGIKVALFAVIAAAVVALFLPSLRQIFIRITTPSETVVLAGEGSTEIGDAGSGDLELEIVTLLGYDGIPAILDPEFVNVDEAEASMDDFERVLGLSINGESRAYSIKMLSRHEVINDVVGGVPVAVTW